MVLQNTLQETSVKEYASRAGTILAAPARVSSGVYANCIKWMQHTLVLQHEALSLKPPKAYVTRLLGGRETTRSLKRKRDRLK